MTAAICKWGRAERGVPVPAGVVSSRANPTVKAIRRLAERREREQTGLACVEGVRLVASAAEAGADIRALVVAEAALASPLGWETVRALRAGGVPVLRVTPDVFACLAYKECAHGLAAVVAQRWTRLEDARPDAGLCWVCLGAAQYPGNLGTVVRTCDAVGGAGVMLLGASADPYDPACVRASLGAIFSQRLVRTDAEALAGWARRHGCTVIGASPNGTTDYREAAYPRPLVLMLGNERNGLTAAEEALCHSLVRIPMAGRCDSLNLAVAAGLALYEAYRWR